MLRHLVESLATYFVDTKFSTIRICLIFSIFSIEKLSMQSILIIFFSFLDPSHLSTYPVACSFSLSLSIKKWKVEIRTKRKHQNKTAQKKKTLESDPYCPTASGYKTIHGSMVEIPRGTPLEKAGLSLSHKHQLQIASWWWVGLYINFPFRAGIVCFRPVSSITDAECGSTHLWSPAVVM